ncbi:DUF2968 domain-containing protein [Cupriavidus plantarum]|uniref:DUF2968 family protein n=1 Tax=Cupriavidus plantarum TaxID=942865 RepID=A0A316EN73_9BURK|nr:DUF2968 domain-containing protein [Cupriavidus plantarum]NYI01561.1 hypothetical protein [Cupriavidus plantarum]PWK33698.1 hypothetical protein C7419_10317 [Cupriavidus plantarum]REE90878.1 hypothetical protein C7418_4174 [Cupriavidus plantarum]RLK33549.1 hypothetical protein C7417_4197 [Cupriavidus plantarum]CAG2148781.1 hypothetical protein LMG26296_04412 [Cupriavidus plantarum]
MTKFIGRTEAVSGFAVAVLLTAGQTAFAQGVSAPDKDAPPAQAARQPVVVAVDASSAGTAQELQQRIAGGTVAALRKTANGSYEAQLLFDRQLGKYYVALLQQQTYWRVIRSGDEVRANANYAMFVRQTERLSDVEMQRARVETQKTQVVQKLVAAREVERRLEADIGVAQEQARLAAERGQEERSQVQDLQAQQDAAQAELRETMSRIARLQQQEKVSGTVTRTR